jgi:hypothetical protein
MVVKEESMKISSSLIYVPSDNFCLFLMGKKHKNYEEMD